MARDPSPPAPEPLLRRIKRLIGGGGVPPPGQPLRATLYTRVGCHLCEEAFEVLQRHGVAVDCVDIDTQPQLRERYGARIPVVVFDGRERFSGRVDPVLLQRLIRGC